MEEKEEVTNGSLWGNDQLGYLSKRQVKEKGH